MSKDRAGQLPLERNSSTTSTDQQHKTSEPATPDSGTSAGGEATGSNQEPDQTATAGGKQSDNGAVDAQAIQPNNVAGAFLVKPVLRNCLKQTVTKRDVIQIEEAESSSSAQDSSNGAKDTVTLCGLTFRADPESKGNERQFGLNLAGGDVGEATGDVMPMMKQESLSAVRVVASSAAEAISRASQNMIIDKLALRLGEAVVVARNSWSFKLDDQRWVVYGRADAKGAPAPELSNGGVVLEYTPVTFSQQRPVDLANFSGNLLDVALTNQLLSKGLLLVQQPDGSGGGIQQPQNVTTKLIRAANDPTGSVLRLIEAPLATFDLLFSDAPTTEFGRFIMGIPSLLNAPTQSAPLLPL